MTSIEWFIEHLLGNGLLRLTKEDHSLYSELRDKAKEMYKQEIKDAYVKGREEHYLDYYPQKHSEEYYQETFGSKGSSEIELTYEERVRWFVNNYYETGMEYRLMLESMRNEDLDNFEWYGEKIQIPKFHNGEVNLYTEEHVEERELTLEERYNIHRKYITEDKLDLVWEPATKENLDKLGVPTKLITITYKDKTIESYE
jgi:hypothetical protein